MLRKLPDFTPQNLANVIWAFATLGAYPGHGLPDAVCRRFEEDLSSQGGHR